MKQVGDPQEWCLVQAGSEASVRDLEGGGRWLSVRIWRSEKKSRPF